MDVWHGWQEQNCMLKDRFASHLRIAAPLTGVWWLLSGSVEIDEVKLNFIVFCSPFLPVFQGENSTVADEDMLTHEEFCSKT